MWWQDIQEALQRSKVAVMQSPVPSKPQSQHDDDVWVVRLACCSSTLSYFGYDWLVYDDVLWRALQEWCRAVSGLANRRTLACCQSEDWRKASCRLVTSSYSACHRHIIIEGGLSNKFTFSFAIKFSMKAEMLLLYSILDFVAPDRFAGLCELCCYWIGCCLAWNRMRHCNPASLFFQFTLTCIHSWELVYCRV